MWRLTLFVAGPSAGARLAADQVHRVCNATVGADRYSLEVVDASADPHRRERDGIIMLPAVACTSPDGVTLRAVGDFSDVWGTAAALGLSEQRPLPRR